MYFRHYLSAAFLVAVTASCFSAYDDAPATPQLLENPGFEQGTANSAAHWGLWPPADEHPAVTTTRDNSRAHSGDYSGRLRIREQQFDGICTWHHPAVPVKAGQQIVLKFWLKAEAVKGKCGCDIQLRSGPKKIVGSRGTSSWKGSFDWRPVVHRFTVPPGADHICVVPYIRGGTGTAWFDDILAWGIPEMSPPRAMNPPDIDGHLTDDCWQTEPAASGFMLADGSGLPKRQTTVHAAYDDRNLYFAFRCQKKPSDTLSASQKKRDADVWRDDDVELFLDIDADRDDYYQFVVNPLGTRYDSHRIDRTWNAEWEAGVHENDEAWMVEMAIPFAELPIDMDVDTHWCANFCRTDRIANEASCWSATFDGFHTPKRFGSLNNLNADLSPLYANAAAGRLASIRANFDRIMQQVHLEASPETYVATVRKHATAIETELKQLSRIQQPKALSRTQWHRIATKIDKLRDRVAQLGPETIRLRLFAKWRKWLGYSPRFGLATTSPMEKVFGDLEGFSGAPRRQLQLHAARNEYEAAQFVAVSLADEDIRDCTMEITPLRADSGAKIPREALELSVVGYVKTAEPRYDTCRIGKWPDPLLPARPFTIKAEGAQPLWLRVYVPPQTPAGDYTGRLSVTAAGHTQTIDVSVHVFDFTLPRRQHLATPFGCSPSDISRWYTGSGDYMDNLPPQIFTRWNRFMLDYRLTPTRVGVSYVKKRINDEGGVTYDYSIMDRCMEPVVHRLPPRGVNMAGVGHFGWRQSRDANMEYTRDSVHNGLRAGLVKWPKTDSWAALVHSLPARIIAKRDVQTFSFWIKAAQPQFADETITAYVNAHPDRWSTTFKVGPDHWHRVRLPVPRYRHLQTGDPLTIHDVAGLSNFRFVIAHKDRPIQFYVDDIIAECPKGNVTIDDFELSGDTAGIAHRVASAVRHWKRKGWFQFGHVYGWDEVQSEKYEVVERAYSQIINRVPDARIMQTYYTSTAPKSLKDTISIWCASTAAHDDEFFAGRRRAGDNTWLYVCCGPHPPYANFFIDQPAIDHRMLFWQVWQKKCTGLLYWRVNYWRGMFTGADDKPLWPDTPWDLKNAGTYIDHGVNGDGWLIYPWHDWTPLPSIRLENIRDGIEDYEYLYKLRQLAPDSELLNVGEKISAGLTDFCRDPALIEKRRRAIARAIESAQLTRIIHDLRKVFADRPRNRLVRVTYNYFGRSARK